MTTHNEAPAPRAGASPRQTAIPHPRPGHAGAPDGGSPAPGPRSGDGRESWMRHGARDECLDGGSPAPGSRPRAGEGRDFRTHGGASDGGVRVFSRVVQGRGGRTTVVELSGELDLAGAPEVARRLAYAFDHVGPRVVLDLAGVTFADTSGLAVVSDFGDGARDAGGRVAVVGASPMVQRVLRSVGHRPVVYPTERDALFGR